MGSPLSDFEQTKLAKHMLRERCNNNPDSAKPVPDIPPMWTKRLLHLRYWGTSKERKVGFTTRPGGIAIWWTYPDYGIKARVAACRVGNRCSIRRTAKQRANAMTPKCAYCDLH